MAEYAWGDRAIPYPILDETDDLLVVDIKGAPTVIPINRVVGRIKDGDRVKVLTTGGVWRGGTVSGYDQYLEIKLDGSDRIHQISTVKNLQT